MKENVNSIFKFEQYIVKSIDFNYNLDSVDGKADLSVRFSLFPRYPMLLNIWLEDEEFPAAGKLLVDKSADHYLTIEDAVTAGELFLRKLKEADDIQAIRP